MDLRRAASLFIVSAVLAVVITAGLVAKKVLLNPILLGTNLWLCVGAVAFGLPISPLAEVMGRVQAFGLYVSVFAVGVALAARASTGTIGMRHPDRRVIRRLSLGQSSYSHIFFPQAGQTSIDRFYF